ncbi:MAG TPA: M12 family metallopeptidase [Phycisphaerae bacterium]|nr:M12 family metallopeptidase [Phycisphaerae bacterium]
MTHNPMQSFVYLVSILVTVAAHAQVEPLEANGIPAGHFLIEGDIIVPEEHLLPRGTFAANFWPSGIVPYVFDANVSSTNQTLMLDAMAAWEEVAVIDFRPRLGDPNYLYIRASSQNSSFVGMKGGSQVVNIFNWNFKFIMAHELAHALGLWHEHSRADRDQFVQINYANICQNCCNGDSCDHNFNIRPGGGGEFGSYDFDSLMHYGQFDFSETGSPTITVLPPNESWQGAIGQRDHISDGDIGTMAFLYGGCASSTTLPVNQSPLNGSINQSAGAPLVWNMVADATGYDVYWGTTNPPTTRIYYNIDRTDVYPPGQPGTTYYWFLNL